MPHFFVKTSDISNNTITVNEKDTVHHLARVLRVRTGEKLLLADENQTQYETIITEIESHKIKTKIISSKKSDHFLKTNLFLAQSVLKNDAQSLVIQKAVELGVKGIIPISSDNTVVKDSVIDTKIEKWQKIALEAVKQCERTDIPKIFERKSLEEILKEDDFRIKIACAEREQKFSLKNYLKSLKHIKEEKILVIIGPEGGFSQNENDLFDKYKITKVTLGRLILRAETAVITALSNVIYELEDESE